MSRCWRGSSTTCNSSTTRCVTPERSEEHTSELQSQPNLVCRLLLEKKNKNDNITITLAGLFVVYDDKLTETVNIRSHLREPIPEIGDQMQTHFAEAPHLGLRPHELR